MSTFAELQKMSAAGAKTLVLFYGAACAPCARLKPRLTELCAHLGLPLQQINIASEMDTVRALGLRSVPTVVSLIGGEAKIVFTGDLHNEAIVRRLQEMGVIGA
jgi:thioredoxin-like negative regulator of GroEL